MSNVIRWSAAEVSKTAAAAKPVEFAFRSAPYRLTSPIPATVGSTTRRVYLSNIGIYEKNGYSLVDARFQALQQAIEYFLVSTLDAKEIERLNAEVSGKTVAGEPLEGGPVGDDEYSSVMAQVVEAAVGRPLAPTRGSSGSPKRAGAK